MSEKMGTARNRPALAGGRDQSYTSGRLGNLEFSSTGYHSALRIIERSDSFFFEVQFFADGNFLFHNNIFTVLKSRATTEECAADGDYIFICTLPVAFFAGLARKR